MEERFQELAMLKLAGRASTEESSELDKLLSENPDFRAEFGQLQREIPAIKDLIPMVQAPETSDEEVPAYEKTAFLTEVGEIFGKPESEAPKEDSSQSNYSFKEGIDVFTKRDSQSYAFDPLGEPIPPKESQRTGFPFFKFALAGLAVWAFVVLINSPEENPNPIATAPEPVVQIAMLDIVGETRGDEDNKIQILAKAWPKNQLETYSEIDAAKSWTEKWSSDLKGPEVKILFDVIESELIIQGNWKGEIKTETIFIEDDLPGALILAKELIAEWYRSENISD